MEIWSGDNFTGNRAECTGACDITRLGAVGNDRARSAKCSCAAPKTTRKLKTETIFELLHRFSFRNNSAAPTPPPTKAPIEPTTTPNAKLAMPQYCASVQPSDRVDCAGLFPGNNAVHNKAGCESLGCCHSPINVPGPWCFQAPWTPVRGRRSVDNPQTMSEFIGEWVPVEIGQSKLSDNQYEFYMNVNGITVHKVELENPKIIDGAQIFAAPPNMEAARGTELKNIFFNSRRLPLPISAKSGDAETEGRAMAKIFQGRYL